MTTEALMEKIDHKGEETGSYLDPRAGKYLTFKLADEFYGIEITRVREIIGVIKITRVPRMPEFILGVINLRGKVIPVTDLRLRFAMPRAEWTQKTCIIVVETGDNGRSYQMGVVADSVADVIDLDDERIDDSPELGASVDTEYILGLGKSESKVALLLDIDRVLTRESVGNAEGAA